MNANPYNCQNYFHKSGNLSYKLLSTQCSTHEWTDFIGHGNLKAMMKVMRFASKRSRNKFKITSIIENITSSSTNILKYPLKKENLTLDQIDINTMMPWCLKTNGTKASFGHHCLRDYRLCLSCDVFEPVFTDHGLCHSFNPSSVIDVLKSSFFTEAFQEAFAEDFISTSYNRTG